MQNICRIQYISDVFTDVYKRGKYMFPKKAPILVLNGNIGHPSKVQTRKFIKYCSQEWDTVFYVPGTHELEGLHNVGFIRHTFSSLPNVTILHNMSVLHRKTNTLFVGSYDNNDYITSTARATSPGTRVVAMSFKVPAIVDSGITAWICGINKTIIKGNNRSTLSDVLRLV